MTFIFLWMNLSENVYWNWVGLCCNWIHFYPFKFNGRLTFMVHKDNFFSKIIPTQKSDHLQSIWSSQQQIASFSGAPHVVTNQPLFKIQIETYMLMKKDNQFKINGINLEMVFCSFTKWCVIYWIALICNLQNK